MHLDVWCCNPKHKHPHRFPCKKCKDKGGRYSVIGTEEEIKLLHQTLKKEKH